VLENTVVAITGAAQGIGRAIALKMAALGADVCVADINRLGAETVADEVRALGRNALALHVDVTDQVSTQNMMRAVSDNFGRLDVAVCNAGIVQVKPFFEITAADWNRTMSVNGLGTFLTLQSAALVMQEQGPMGPGRPHGKIINMASIAGRYGAGAMAPMTPHYRASKAAVISLTQTASFGLAPKITVNAVCPGIVDTDMWTQIDREWGEAEQLQPGEAWKSRTAAIPMGRPQTSADVADVVGFLSSPSSDYMTGQSINVDGGLALS